MSKFMLAPQRPHQHSREQLFDWLLTLVCSGGVLGEPYRRIVQLFYLSDYPLYPAAKKAADATGGKHATFCIHHRDGLQ